MDMCYHLFVGSSESCIAKSDTTGGIRLWLNGYAEYAVMFMKATRHRKSALSAEFLQRSSASRKTAR